MKTVMITQSAADECGWGPYPTPTQWNFTPSSGFGRDLSAGLPYNQENWEIVTAAEIKFQESNRMKTYQPKVIVCGLFNEVAYRD